MVLGAQPPTLADGDLVLEPLMATHAGEMFDVLADPAIYRYLDYRAPPSAEHLRRVYSRLESRQSPDGDERWLNWAIRASDCALIGYVQATVKQVGHAWVAYVLSSRYWGHGYASRAVRALLTYLETSCGVTYYMASVEVENQRSISLLSRLGLRPATAAEQRAQEISDTERLLVCERIGQQVLPR